MRSCLVLMMLMLLPALAQRPNLEAELDRSPIQLGESTLLTVTVSGGVGLSQPSTPVVDGATVRLSGTMSNLVQRGYTVEQSTTFTYLITPTRDGTLIIPPVEVVAGGRRLRSQAQRLEVLGSPRPSRPARSFETRPGMFVEAEVQPKVVFQGQPIFHEFGFYRRIDLRSNPSLTATNSSGFLTLPFPQKQSTEILGRYTYYVTKLKTAYFPLAPGDYEIPAVQLTAQRLFQFSPDVLVSRAFPVKVRPLPTQGKTDDFSGAVGRFRFRCKLDSHQAKVGEPLTLERVIEGDGHVDLIPDLPLPPLPGFKVYDTEASGHTRATNGGQVDSEKTFRTVLIPTEPGVQVLSSLKFSFFDPDRGAYETLTAQDLKLTVTGQALTSEEKPPQQDSAEPTAPLAEPVLRPLKEAPPRQSWDLLQSPAFGMVQLVPLGALVVLVVLPWLRGRLTGAWERFRPRGRKNLVKEIESASTEDLARLFHQALSQAVGRPTGGLPHRKLARLLDQSNLPEETVDNILAWLQQADEARFGGRSLEGNLKHQAIELVKAIR